MPIDALTCLGFLSKSKPQTFTTPDDLITVPAKIFIKVVLPAPLGPSRPNISPCFTSKFNLFIALTSLDEFFEYIFVNSFTDSAFSLFINNLKQI